MRKKLNHPISNPCLLLTSCFPDTEQYDVVCDAYFSHLKTFLGDFGEFNSLEQEWRALWPLVVADFERFLIGWDRNHWKRTDYSRRVSDSVCQAIIGKLENFPNSNEILE